MMALAWWRLSHLLRRAQAAGITLAALLAGGVAVTAWPSAPSMAAAGPLQLFRGFCVVQWIAAAAAALWASTAGDGAADQAPPDGVVSETAGEAELAWEDWFTYGRLGAPEVALGLSLAGSLAGAGLALLMLPLGAFAAAASGAGAGQLLGTTLLALLASDAAAAWGTAIQVAAPGALRATAATLVMGSLAAIGYLAVSPFLPEGRPAMLSAVGALRFAAGLAAFGAAGMLAAVAAVRRHVRLTFGEGGDRDADGRPAV
ncbi:MAG: hypothetical protein AB1609_18270 [Bacillota bacterium]